MEYCVIALNEASCSTANRLDLLNCDQPVWFLGRLYNLPQDLDDLQDDIRSKLWITYRRNFPPIIGNTRYITDKGFGCMIRCGQMVLANALIYKDLGRQWRWKSNSVDENPEAYLNILKLFQDKIESKYSIHNIVQTGQQEGKAIGEWFGPNTIAQALKKMSKHDKISIEVALDNVIITDEIRSSCKKATNKQELQPSFDGDVTKSTNVEWVPSILFIPLRLGLTKINPLYFDALKKTFQFRQSLGIIGGRPNHALYLVGFTDDDIIYLDPHKTQPYIDFDAQTPIDPNDQNSSLAISTSQAITSSLGFSSPNLSSDVTYHCEGAEKMSIERLDPSIALCFYFHTEEEFDDWCEESNKCLINGEQQPMFEITKQRPPHWAILSSNLLTTTNSSNTHLEKLSQSNGSTSFRTDHDPEKFTLLKDEKELDAPVKSELTKSNSIETNDDVTFHDEDEEFEMLG